MPPRIKAIIAEEATMHGVPFELIVGPNRRRTSPVVKARWSIIARIYNPTYRGGSTRNGISEISRHLGLDHTTVLNAVRKMGIHQRIRP
jgi:chromosomal replication initiation ATPase DnaA